MTRKFRRWAILQALRCIWLPVALIGLVLIATACTREQNSVVDPKAFSLVVMPF